MSELIDLHGGCHCRAVRFTVTVATKTLECCDCNCSICSMKQNHHFIVPSSRFVLDPGSEEAITTYTFNTHQAKHKFCKKCGVQAFYTPRSNPDGMAVTVYCMDQDELKEKGVTWTNVHFDGQNWEKHIVVRPDITEMSKLP